LPKSEQELVRNDDVREGKTAMNFLNNLSDDQMALVMCVGALLTCGLLMSLSHFIGTARQEDPEVRLSVPESKDSDQSQRKAA
jgi:hypothetical protein